MIRRNALLLAALASLASTPAFAQTEAHVVDKGHSNVLFTVRHMVARMTGRFEDYDMKLSIDRAKPENSSVEFTIKATSVNTDNADRDKHLRSPDFFDVEKFPEITFKSTKVTPKGDDAYEVTGDFTLHGVTKSVTLPVSYLGMMKDGRGNEKGGFEAAATLNRKDYGITWNRAFDTGGVVLGDDVKITVNLETRKVAPAAAIPPPPPAPAEKK
jgi:polyisoprenoid-binding protein YceI